MMGIGGWVIGQAKDLSHFTLPQTGKDMGGVGGEKKNSVSMRMYLSICSVAAGPRCQTG